MQIFDPCVYRFNCDKLLKRVIYLVSYHEHNIGQSSNDDALRIRLFYKILILPWADIADCIHKFLNQNEINSK